jgi:hypothetical protein
MPHSLRESEVAHLKKVLEEFDWNISRASIVALRW